MILRKGIVISNHTGILCCESFKPVHEYVEEILTQCMIKN